MLGFGARKAELFPSYAAPGSFAYHGDFPGTSLSKHQQLTITLVRRVKLQSDF